MGLPSVGSVLIRMSLPMEFGPTPALGIVQGAETQLGVKAFPTRYLRVQLSTGPGEAGSPVFDAQGRFVGMTVAVLPEIGASFILPARAIAWVRDGLLADSGVMRYSYFGFHAEEDRSGSVPMQLAVNGIDPKSPAESAGLKEGDVIVTVAKRLCGSLSDLRDAAFYTKPGQYLDLTVRRGGVEIPIAIQAQAQ
jgi:S1-C subfamily serine protease